MTAKKPAPEIRKQARIKAIKDAEKVIERFQDIIGWQKGESRNKLIHDIEKEVRKLRHGDII